MPWCLSFHNIQDYPYQVLPPAHHGECPLPELIPVWFTHCDFTALDLATTTASKFIWLCVIFVIVLFGDDCSMENYNVWPCDVFHYCSTAVVNDLSALGQHQPSWRECLSKHLMPLNMIVQLPDGKVGVEQRVLPESPLVPIGTLTIDKVSDIGRKWEK